MIFLFNRAKIMNERQKNLLKNLRVEAHLARALNIGTSAFYSKLHALKAGKTPVLTAESKTNFSTAYEEKQVEFWGDLAVIAAENLKELKVES